MERPCIRFSAIITSKSLTTQLFSNQKQKLTNFNLRNHIKLNVFFELYFATLITIKAKTVNLVIQFP